MDNINKKTLDMNHNGSAIMIRPQVFDVMYITGMYDAYCTYVDDKYFDNHDNDDDTDADTNNDTVDDTDDDMNTHIIVWSINDSESLPHP